MSSLSFYNNSVCDSTSEEYTSNISISSNDIYSLGLNEITSEGTTEINSVDSEW
jgi:hypothetical protein